jgi:hypothetical protein
MRRLIACAVMSCGARPPIDHPDAQIRLAIAGDRKVSLAVVEHGAIRVTRTVAAPGTIAQLDWAGDDPVVRIGKTPMGFGPDGPIEAHDDPNVIGQIARITARGYEPFPALPAATWPPAADSSIDPQWELVSPPDGSIWQGRCSDGFYADGRVVCEHFTYARLAPGPVSVLPKAPEVAREPELPPIAAPAEPRVELVSIGDDKQILRCTDRDAASEFPPAKERDRDFLGMGQLAWLSADPPLFRIAKASAGFDVNLDRTIFERCAPSRELGALVQTGRDGLVAVFGGPTLLVLQNGRLVGKGAVAAGLVRFAPR